MNDIELIQAGIARRDMQIMNLEIEIQQLELYKEKL